MVMGAGLQAFLIVQSRIVPAQLVLARPGPADGTRDGERRGRSPREEDVLLAAQISRAALVASCINRQIS